MDYSLKKDDTTDGYIINGTYMSDVRLLFSAVPKEDMMIMIKRGFIGLQDHPCENIADPVSWQEYLQNSGKTCHWKNIQCPLHKSQNNQCDYIKSQSANNYEPCVILANYLTAKLIIKRI